MTYFHIIWGYSGVDIIYVFFFQIFKVFKSTEFDSKSYHQPYMLPESFCIIAPTMVFFSSALSDCPGLECAQVVRRLRFQAHVLLDEATCEQRGRFGELLLLLPPLQSTAWQMVEQLQLARLLGEANMDSLLQEMLLGESATGNRC